MFKNKFMGVLIGIFMLGDLAYGWYPYHRGHHSAGAFVAGTIVGASIRRGHRKKVRRSKKRRIVSVMTVEKKIQKSLTALGFYHGKIDGEVNSYETRSAIKAMNIEYKISETSSLELKTKDALIFLGDLFIFDRNLISNSTTKKAKGKKIQTALKIHGFYHDKIDGMIGSGTRANISEYKVSKNLSSGSRLDFEEEYQLIDSAKKMNDKNIDDTIASLKSSLDPQKQSVSTEEKSSKVEGLK